MLQTKSINKEAVAVAYDPCAIYLRRHGKAEYKNERLLLKIKEDAVEFYPQVAMDLGLPVRILSPEEHT